MPEYTPQSDTTALTGVVQALPELVKESKEGYKTTEFWLAIVTGILIQVNAIPLPERYEGFATAALAAVYALSRGIAKSGVPASVTPAAVADAPST